MPRKQMHVNLSSALTRAFQATLNRSFRPGPSPANDEAVRSPSVEHGDINPSPAVTAVAQLACGHATAHRQATMASVELGKANGLPCATLTHESGATALVYVYAAHLASWKTPDGQEQIYMSSKAEYGGGKAMRGGVPICWPQFNGARLSRCVAHAAPTTRSRLLSQRDRPQSAATASGTVSAETRTSGRWCAPRRSRTRASCWA